ncbi:phage holin family protein [Williamsia deligens]|uniref:Phage holin family protein n=1 Tax=Williamsia deligens TaxID=321325 RepID=A0ABW3GB06_9NOCA|nr:phage holin family protein [Williamsia deligens]MCP2193286.1 putative Holin-X, holin superfamily III [Williamsia deligens]
MKGSPVSLDDRAPIAGDRAVSSIPLTDPHDPATQSIGGLVKDATAHMSTLLRAEVELAKAEVVGEAKKAAIGGVLFLVAGAIALYSSFFFFFFLAELLDEWLPRWAAFGIVFLILVVITVIAGIVGFIFFKRIRGPKKTIETVKAVPSVIPGTGKGAPVDLPGGTGVAPRR